MLINYLSRLLKILYSPIFLISKKSRSSSQKKLMELKARIKRLEEKITELESTPTNRTTINRYIVKEMKIEKFEMNVDSIDVDEVKGALNVGIIHNSVVNEEKRHHRLQSFQIESSQKKDKNKNQHKTVSLHRNKKSNDKTKIQKPNSGISTKSGSN